MHSEIQKFFIILHVKPEIPIIREQIILCPLPNVSVRIAHTPFFTRIKGHQAEKLLICLKITPVCRF